MNKDQLRRQWLAQRRSLPQSDWQQRSLAICQQLQQSPWYQQARTVLIYSSYRQEPDLSHLLLNTDKVWGYPRCVGQNLQWHYFQPGQDQLQPGAFGILEPAPDQPQLPAAAVDLILLPAVGLDHCGYRLGYGGGFYDRLLADPQWQHCRTIGISFVEMVVEQLPFDPWDQPLQSICSEAGWALARDPVTAAVSEHHRAIGTVADSVS